MLCEKNCITVLALNTGKKGGGVPVCLSPRVAVICDANIAISRVQVLTQGVLYGDGDEYDVESVCGRERSLCVLRCHFSLVL